MKFTYYFQFEVLVKRPELKTEWLEKALQEHSHMEVQKNGRIRYWTYIPEEDKYLRVVTLEDGETILNAFFDRDYPDNI